MSYGYSVKLVSLNKSASIKSLGVKLGRECIKYNVPVSHVAERLGVYRQTVYNWFTGECLPNEQTRKNIEKFINKIQR